MELIEQLHNARHFCHLCSRTINNRKHYRERSLLRFFGYHKFLHSLFTGLKVGDCYLTTTPNLLLNTSLNSSLSPIRFSNLWSPFFSISLLLNNVTRPACVGFVQTVFLTK